jgi:hypothetical protein
MLYKQTEAQAAVTEVLQECLNSAQKSDITTPSDMAKKILSEPLVRGPRHMKTSLLYCLKPYMLHHCNDPG